MVYFECLGEGGGGGTALALALAKNKIFLTTLVS